MSADTLWWVCQGISGIAALVMIGVFVMRFPSQESRADQVDACSSAVGALCMLVAVPWVVYLVAATHEPAGIAQSVGLCMATFMTVPVGAIVCMVVVSMLLGVEGPDY